MLATPEDPGLFCCPFFTFMNVFLGQDPLSAFDAAASCSWLTFTARRKRGIGGRDGAELWGRL